MTDRANGMTEKKEWFLAMKHVGRIAISAVLSIMLAPAQAFLRAPAVDEYTITTVAGGADPTNLPDATAAWLANPWGVAVDGSGIWIAATTAYAR